MMLPTMAGMTTWASTIGKILLSRCTQLTDRVIIAGVLQGGKGVGHAGTEIGVALGDEVTVSVWQH